MPVHAMPVSQRSTLDLDSRQKRQVNVSVIETNSTAQYRSVRYVARVCTSIACIVRVLYNYSTY